jgi:UDP-2,3-diacylglucosamine pyrophosphatase LpxH
MSELRVIAPSVDTSALDDLEHYLLEEEPPRKRTQSPRNVTDTLVLSDLHLGSEVCRARELVKLIKGIQFRRLIILGDAFDDTRFHRLRRSHFKVLSLINKLSAPKRGIEVVWVEGNHDSEFLRVVGAMLGVRVYPEYAFTVGGRRYLAIHGHQFDQYMSRHPVVSAIAGRFYTAIQRRDSRTQAVSRYLKRRSKSWLKVSDEIAEKATRHARRRGADVVLCGHTHQPLHRRSLNGVEYLNTGCWTDVPSTYVTIDASGARLNEVGS